MAATVKHNLKPRDLPKEVEELVCKGWTAVVRLPNTVVGIFPSKERAEDYVNGIYANQFDSVNAPLFAIVPERHC